MLRMLIVDDEERIVHSMYNLMDEHFDFELHRCYSAVQALQEVRAARYDIILSDISMPQMSGLELLEETRKLWPKCYFILLTGFSKFEYAYQTLQYERVDYVLKLESYEKICEVVQKQKRLIEREKQEEETLARYEQDLNHLNTSALRLFLKRIIVQGTPLPEQDEMNALGLPLQLDRPMVPVLAAINGGDLVNRDRIAEELDAYLNARLEPLGMRCLTYVSMSCNIFVVQLNGRESVEGKMVFIHTLLENLPSMVGQQLHAELALICPEHFIAWENAHDLYERAVIALENIRNESGMMILVEAENDARRPEADFPGFEETQLLWNMIKCGDMAGFETMLRKGADKRALEGPIPPGIVLLLREAARLYAPEFIQGTTYKHIVSIRYQAGEWVQDVLDAIVEISHAHKQSRESQGAWLITRINQYIEQHYMEDVTLTGLADVMHYSPSYLSRMYKLKTGRNLISALYNVRISKAKELLAHSTLKTNEIAERSGFCSLKYFNRVFKKETGISAAQYRNEQMMLKKAIEN